MKKIYTLIFATVFSAASLQAQLVLTKADYEPTAGSAELTQSYDSVAVLPRNIGQNQTWNFSAITQATTSVDTVFCVSPSTIPSASLFPGANLATINATDYYSFFKSSSSPTTQLEYLGYDDVHAYANYTNTAIQAIWPIAYGYSNTDTYFGPLTGQATGTRGGTITAQATGSGTVIMPGGAQFTNVLQLRNKTIDVQDPVGFNSLTITSTSYSYYRVGERSSFINVGEIFLSSSTGTFSAAGVSTSSTIAAAAPTGLRSNSNTLSFVIFPNPVKTDVNVFLSNPKNEACVVQIYNLMGSLVKELNAGRESTVYTAVPVSELAPGIYTVKTTLGGKSAVKKFVIE